MLISAELPRRNLLLLARATYIMVFLFTHIPFVVNHTINATPPCDFGLFGCVYKTTGFFDMFWQVSMNNP